MNKKTAKALEDGIAHWDRHATGTERKGEKPDRADCALCGLFWSNGCLECPVSENSGEAYCRNTPFNAAYREWWRIADKQPNARPGRFRKAAARMCDFLKSLRDTP